MAAIPKYTLNRETYGSKSAQELLALAEQKKAEAVNSTGQTKLNSLGMLEAIMKEVGVRYGLPSGYMNSISNPVILMNSQNSGASLQDIVNRTVDTAASSGTGWKPTISTPNTVGMSSSETAAQDARTQVLRESVGAEGTQTAARVETERQAARDAYVAPPPSTPTSTGGTTTTAVNPFYGWNPVYNDGPNLGGYTGSVDPNNPGIVQQSTNAAYTAARQTELAAQEQAQRDAFARQQAEAARQAEVERQRLAAEEAARLANAPLVTAPSDTAASTSGTGTAITNPTSVVPTQTAQAPAYTQTVATGTATNPNTPTIDSTRSTETTAPSTPFSNINIPGTTSAISTLGNLPTDPTMYAGREAAYRSALESVNMGSAVPNAGSVFDYYNKNQKNVGMDSYDTIRGDQGVANIAGLNSDGTLSSNYKSVAQTSSIPTTSAVLSKNASVPSNVLNASGTNYGYTAAQVGAIDPTQAASTTWDASKYQANATTGTLSAGASAADKGATATMFAADGTLLPQYKTVATQAGLDETQYAKAAELGFTNPDGTLKSEYKALAKTISEAEAKKLEVDAAQGFMSKSPEEVALAQSQGKVALLQSNSDAITGNLLKKPSEVPPPLGTPEHQLWRDSWADYETKKALYLNKGETTADLAATVERIVDTKETVQGQLAIMFANTPDGQVPLWAKPAVDKAEAVLAARGFSNSTVARDALYSAIITSATPIAAQDAQTYKSAKDMTAQFLQQTEITNAASSQRLQEINLDLKNKAKEAQLNKEFDLFKTNLDNNQKAKIFNATMYGDIAKLNLTNQQQTELFNVQTYNDIAKLNLSNKQQAELANLAADLDMAKLNAQLESSASQSNAETARQQWLSKLDASVKTELFNAANIAAMDMANADRTQQVSIANAQNYLNMAMSNTNLEQQRLMADRQNQVQILLSNMAADNMAKQFSEQSKLDIFKLQSEIATQVEMDNARRADEISMYNNTKMQEAAIHKADLETRASETNAQILADLTKSQAQLTQQNNEFNTNNSMLISKYNAELLANLASKDADLVTQANIQASANATQNRGYSFDFIASELTALAEYNKSIDYANIQAMASVLGDYYGMIAKIQEATLVSGADIQSSIITADANDKSNDVSTILAGLTAGATAFKSIFGGNEETK